MKKRDKLQRIEYLTEEQRGVRSLLASNNILASRLSSTVTADKYNLKSPSDLRTLLFSLDAEIDKGVTTIYSQVLNENGRMSELGIKHSITNIEQDVRVNYYKTVGTGDALARNYAETLLRDGKKLSDRIWTSEQRAKIYQLVGEASRDALSPFQLAENIQAYVGDKYPRYLIDRIANTELIQAYTNGKKETYGEFLNDFGDEYKVIVKIELSPFHPVPDICDATEGTYDIGDAPDVPIHPGCMCGRTEQIVPVTRKVKTETVDSLIEKRQGIIQRDNIYLPKEAGGIPI